MRTEGYTAKEFEEYKAFAIHDSERRNAGTRGPITQKEVEYMINAANAPDVNIFLALI